MPRGPRPRPQSRRPVAFFTTRRTVTITGVGGATLRYTTTGADPTASDTLVPGGGQVVVDRAGRS